MKVSLVMATIGERLVEIERFMASLDRQTYRDFELIVVDQNEDERLRPLIEQYGMKFPLLHVRSGRGLSKARNAGLSYAGGDIVAFPDDDCWYGSEVLGKAADFMLRNPSVSGLTGRSLDENDAESAGKYDPDAGYIDKMNVWRRAISYTVFLRKSAADEIGGFDERLGAGADTIYGSGEETDYVLRLLPKHRIMYDPGFIVRHPDPLRRYTRQTADRAYRYGCGFGKVAVKHGYPATFKLNALARPIAGMLLYAAALRFAKSMYYWSSFKGRLRGMK